MFAEECPFKVVSGPARAEAIRHARRHHALEAPAVVTFTGVAVLHFKGALAPVHPAGTVASVVTVLLSVWMGPGHIHSYEAIASVFERRKPHDRARS
jgi:hypothetical protein